MDHASSPDLPSSRRVWAARAITAVVVAVGLYDVVVGLVMLTSPTPWVAHGPGTAWPSLATQVGTSPADPLLGLFRRMGAFSLHAGVCTIVWALLGYRRPRFMTALFVTYACTGMGFGLTDATFFAGTPYLFAKRVVGAFFFAALLGHFALRRAERRVGGARGDQEQPR